MLGRTLPLEVTTRSFRKDRNLQHRDNPHGVLCAEVVHALAPEANLLFANWEADSPASFLRAVRWARSEGASIISCSVIVPSWSDGDGGGAVHDELAEALGVGTPDEVLFFASAGNTAQRSWTGLFTDGGRGLHHWAPGVTTNQLFPWGAERVSVDLTAPAGCDFDLIVRDLKNRRIVVRGNKHPGRDRCSVSARFVPAEGREYGIQVTQRLPRNQPARFHVYILGGGLKEGTRRGSIPFPGDGAHVITVGAVDGAGRRMPYSSCGPSGVEPKPDLVAIVPFPGKGKQEPFTGTSAAAPQAAGLAALLWGRNPSWTGGQVRRSLAQNAQRTFPEERHSYETGFGMVRLPMLPPQPAPTADP
jgi:subtilisin family serine protease